MQLYQTGHEKGYDWLLGTAPAASDAVSCYINQATLTRLFTLNEMIAPIDLSNSGTFHVLTARWWWYKNKWPEEKRAVRCSVAAKLVIRRAENSLCTNKYTVAGGSPRRWWRPSAWLQSGFHIQGFRRSWGWGQQIFTSLICFCFVRLCCLSSI